MQRKETRLPPPSLPFPSLPLPSPPFPSLPPSPPQTPDPVPLSHPDGQITPRTFPLLHAIFISSKRVHVEEIKDAFIHINSFHIHAILDPIHVSPPHAPLIHGSIKRLWLCCEILGSSNNFIERHERHDSDVLEFTWVYEWSFCRSEYIISVISYCLFARRKRNVTNKAKVSSLGPNNIILSEYDQGRQSPFRMGGGGGGAKVRKMSNFSARNSQNKTLRAAKLKIVYVLYNFYVKFNGFIVLFKPILALHYCEFFKLSKLLGGGGKTICCPPIFSLGGGGGRLLPAPPPPPQDRRLWVWYYTLYLLPRPLSLSLSPTLYLLIPLCISVSLCALISYSPSEYTPPRSSPYHCDET